MSGITGTIKMVLGRGRMVVCVLLSFREVVDIHLPSAYEGAGRYDEKHVFSWNFEFRMSFREFRRNIDSFDNRCYLPRG